MDSACEADKTWFFPRDVSGKRAPDFRRIYFFFLSKIQSTGLKQYIFRGNRAVCAIVSQRETFRKIDYSRKYECFFK